MKTILVDTVYCFVLVDGKNSEIFSEMYTLLETFPNKKILLTGASSKKFKELGLDKMPYKVFTLSQNPPKSDPKYYEIMLQHFGLNKDDVVYFDQNHDAVKSAQSIGISTYYYDPIKKDLAKLKEFLVNNL